MNGQIAPLPQVTRIEAERYVANVQFAQTSGVWLGRAGADDIGGSRTTTVGVVFTVQPRDHARSR